MLPPSAMALQLLQACRLDLSTQRILSRVTGIHVPTAIGKGFLVPNLNAGVQLQAKMTWAGRKIELLS